MSRSHKKYDMKGDIKTSASNKEYRAGWDNIFVKKDRLTRQDAHRFIEGISKKIHSLVKKS